MEKSVGKYYHNLYPRNAQDKAVVSCIKKDKMSINALTSKSLLSTIFMFIVCNINYNDNNGGTAIYKTELNLENKKEKSRPNFDEFKRLLSGGESGI